MKNVLLSFILSSNSFLLGMYVVSCKGSDLSQSTACLITLLKPNYFNKDQNIKHGSLGDSSFSIWIWGYTNTQSISFCSRNFTVNSFIARETYFFISISLKNFNSFQQSFSNLKAKVSFQYYFNQLRVTLKVKFLSHSWVHEIRHVMCFAIKMVIWEENRYYHSERTETKKKER